jgi:multicomponent Na+:H+ antiporter subunit E
MNRIPQFILAFVTWMLLTWSFSIQNIVGGAIAGLVCAFLFGDLFPRQNLWQMYNPRRLFWVLVYIPVFIWLCLKANVDVLYRVLHPNLPINPGIVKVKTELKSEMGKAFLANSITLTPGTMTVDMVGQTLYIHWINVPAEEPEKKARNIVMSFEPYLKRIFE